MFLKTQISLFEQGV